MWVNLIVLFIYIEVYLCVYKYKRTRIYAYKIHTCINILLYNYELIISYYLVKYWYTYILVLHVYNICHIHTLASVCPETLTQPGYAQSTTKNGWGGAGSSEKQPLPYSWTEKVSFLSREWKPWAPHFNCSWENSPPLFWPEEGQARLGKGMESSSASWSLASQWGCRLLWAWPPARKMYLDIMWEKYSKITKFSDTLNMIVSQMEGIFDYLLIWVIFTTEPFCERGNFIL